QHIDQLPPNKLKEKLETYADQAKLSQTLATIVLDTPVDADFDDCNLSIPDLPAFIGFLDKWEFKRFKEQAPDLLAPFLNGHPVVEQGTHNPLAVGSDKSPTNGSVNADSAGMLQALQNESSPLRVEHQVVQTQSQLNDMIAVLTQAKVFALDIETTGLDVLNDELVGIAISVIDPDKQQPFEMFRRPAVNILNLSKYPTEFDAIQLKKTDGAIDFSLFKTWYIPVGHELAEQQLDKQQVLKALEPLLTAKDVVKIAHNAKFELNFFKSFDLCWQGLVFDTMIASYIHSPERRHGLKTLSYDVLKLQMQEIKELIGSGKKMIPFSQVPVLEGAAYAACDAYVTLALAIHFLQVLDEDACTLFYEIELPLVHVLGEMERHGVGLDTAYLGELSKQLDTEITQVEKDVYRLAEVEFNINSPKQVGEVLFDKLGITPLRKTAKKTGYSTDAKVLEQLAGEHEVVEKILDYRQLFKLKSTYVDSLPTLCNSKTDRIHTSFNQTVAATGRLSSSDPNLQNIPIRTDYGRLIRKAFIPAHRDGWSLLSADYSQIELRLLAHFSEDPNLVTAFQNGEDIHTATASLVFGIPKDAIKKEQRYNAKAVNFGIIYGQTAHGLSQQLKVPRAEAQFFIDRYFQQYSKVKAFIESVKQEAHKTGRVKTLCGRIRDFTEGLRSSNRSVREFSERAAFNTPLQGSAADLIKVAMIRLARTLEESGVQSKMILQVHDEVVLEVPDEELAQVTDMVIWAMELNQPLNVPLVVDVNIGKTWMET
ncbi:MAG: DNA polymerase I, partial [Vampirovibrio sp.]|nr:DNA polymerase I [Vampirovibrio sp.]